VCFNFVGAFELSGVFWYGGEWCVLICPVVDFITYNGVFNFVGAIEMSGVFRYGGEWCVLICPVVHFIT